MVQRRKDGTLRVTARLDSNNWMKPNPERRAVEDELYYELDRDPTDEEVEERMRSTSNSEPGA